MKVCLSLICLFFLIALQDGDAGKTYTRMEGENITVGCLLLPGGSKRIFCKENCDGKNILIETTADRVQKGRFSIEYENRGYFSSVILHVSINELKQSDSGRYRCGLDGPHENFELVVTEGLQLYLVLTLVAKIILLSTPLVIFIWKRRTMKSKDPAVETDYAAVSQINPERKKIRQNKTSADEIFSVYP